MEGLGGWSISPKMINWIFDNLPQDSIILELGSGYATKLLVEKYKVYSIEQDPNWMNKYRGSNYIYSPIKDYENYKWYDLSFINEIDKNYDLLLVDGPTQASGGRYGLLEHIDKFYNSNAIIIFDDVNRKEDLDVMMKLSKKINRSFKVIFEPEKQFGICKPKKG